MSSVGFLLSIPSILVSGAVFNNRVRVPYTNRNDDRYEH